MNNQELQLLQLGIAFVGLIALPPIGQLLTQRYYERIRPHRGYFLLASMSVLLLAFFVLLSNLTDPYAVGHRFWWLAAVSMMLSMPILHDPGDFSPAWRLRRS